jgi:hypothetical protein
MRLGRTKVESSDAEKLYAVASNFNCTASAPLAICPAFFFVIKTRSPPGFDSCAPAHSTSRFAHLCRASPRFHSRSYPHHFTFYVARPARSIHTSSFTLPFLSDKFRALMSSPEEFAREKIDALLQQCGWLLQSRSTINLSASRGIAIREALLKDRDEVDYLLFVDGKAIGTVEAKPQGFTLIGV